MATIERCKVTSVGSRLVYGLDRDTAGTADRRVCFRRHDSVLISEDDVVLIRPWDWQDEKADVTWRYEKQEADQLREEGHIQEP